MDGEQEGFKITIICDLQQGLHSTKLRSHLVQAPEILWLEVSPFGNINPAWGMEQCAPPSEKSNQPYYLQICLPLFFTCIRLLQGLSRSRKLSGHWFGGKHFGRGCPKLISKMRCESGFCDFCTCLLSLLWQKISFILKDLAPLCPPL